MRLGTKKYQKSVTGKQAKAASLGCGIHKLAFGSAVMALLAVAAPVNAGYISPSKTGGVDCDNTASFTTYNDCIGQVTSPKDEANGDPTTLENYLNGLSIDKKDTLGFLGFDDETTPWGVQGDWLGISNQLNAPNELPGASTDGFFTVTAKDRYSGGWTFDLGDLIIDYLVVTVNDGGGWSGYFYDFTEAENDISIFSSTWDTLGITTGSGTTSPEISHMYAAYITGGGTPDPDPDPNPDPNPNPVPVPGTLLLLGLGLLTLRVSRRARFS